MFRRAGLGRLNRCAPPEDLLGFCHIDCAWTPGEHPKCGVQPAGVGRQGEVSGWLLLVLAERLAGRAC